ncbi:MAG: YebC/PmpR family DNA-binding transcriptional regulator, partial [Turicibacter sanguinis]
VYADQDQFHAVQTALNGMGITEFEAAELTMLPTSTVELDGDALAKFEKLIDVLEDLDDVQQVYHNVELPDEE